MPTEVPLTFGDNSHCRDLCDFLTATSRSQCRKWRNGLLWKVLKASTDKSLLSHFPIWNDSKDSWEVTLVTTIRTNCCSLSRSILSLLHSKPLLEGVMAGWILFLVIHLLDRKYFHWALLRSIIEHFITFICLASLVLCLHDSHCPFPSPKWKKTMI